eukprot:7730926-Lingulodinium_polyedra.AAC.1
MDLGRATDHQPNMGNIYLGIVATPEQCLALVGPRARSSRTRSHRPWRLDQQLHAWRKLVAGRRLEELVHRGGQLLDGRPGGEQLWARRDPLNKHDAKAATFSMHRKQATATTCQDGGDIPPMMKQPVPGDSTLALLTLRGMLRVPNWNAKTNGPRLPSMAPREHRVNTRPGFPPGSKHGPVVRENA